MVALLDVNVLIALVDPRHVHHESAHRWFADHQQLGWATCPITQNGVLRVLGHARYPNGPGSPAAVLPLLEALIAHPQHVFWSDAISLVGPGLLNHQALLDSGQITDLYLLAMAHRLAVVEHRRTHRRAVRQHRLSSRHRHRRHNRHQRNHPVRRITRHWRRRLVERSRRSAECSHRLVW